MTFNKPINKNTFINDLPKAQKEANQGKKRYLQDNDNFKSLIETFIKINKDNIVKEDETRLREVAIKFDSLGSKVFWMTVDEIVAELGYSIGMVSEFLSYDLVQNYFNRQQLPVLEGQQRKFLSKLNNEGILNSTEIRTLQQIVDLIKNIKEINNNVVVVVYEK